MKAQLITFDTAKLAKDKGFDWVVRGFFLYLELHEDVNTKGDYNSYAWVTTWRNTSTDDTISAPTQSLLQKWLREVHDIHTAATGQNIGGNVWVYTQHKNVFIPSSYSKESFKTYEEALEKGLQKALKLIP
jgi:hypothetical protein